MEMTHPKLVQPQMFNDSFLQSVLAQLSDEDKRLLIPEANAASQKSVPVKLSGRVSTNGWDTVCAVRASDLNRAIKEKKTYPENIDYQFIDDGATASIKSTFGPWAISPGGDGSNINVKIPLQNGSFSYDGAEYSLDGGEAIAQVKLSYFPEVLNSPAPGNYDLKVSLSSKDPYVPVVSVIQYENKEHKLPKLMAGACKEVLNEWLTQNLAKFDAIFSTVSLESLSEETEFKWLKSTFMSYAYTDTGSLSSSVFGVLCMTNDRSPISLARQIDGACLQGEEKACFVIKKELFAKYQFLPALPFAFDDASASDFSLNKTENGITAKNLKLSSVRYGAIDYHPEVENFEVWFEQTYIRTKTKVRTSISPGIESIVTITTYQTLKLSEKNGKQYIEYETTQEPDITKTTEVSAGVIVTEAIAGIILAVAAIVAGEVIKEVVKKVIVCIIIAIVAALISIVIHEIIDACVGGHVSDKIPSVSPMVKMATRQILWPMCDPQKPDGFKLEHVFYNDSLVLCGSPAYLL